MSDHGWEDDPDRFVSYGVLRGSPERQKIEAECEKQHLQEVQRQKEKLDRLERLQRDPYFGVMEYGKEKEALKQEKQNVEEQIRQLQKKLNDICGKEKETNHLLQQCMDKIRNQY
jgi:hypothetical protein